MAPPAAFSTPIFNHLESAPHQTDLANPSQGNHTHLGGMSSIPEHNCQCGDACSCFGCAAHPKNATMTEYVRQMAQVMQTGEANTWASPIYDLPTYPHQPGFGAEAQPNNAITDPFGGYASNNNSMMPTGHINFSESIHPLIAPNSMSTSWQPHQPALHQQHSFQQEYYPPNQQISDMSLNIKTEDIAPSPNEGEGEEGPTLSPSAFLWQEMELPGCSDATGTCQCGDGCLCVGCLTHGGHNGVELDPAPLTGQGGLSDLFNINDFTTGTVPPVMSPGMNALT